MGSIRWSMCFWKNEELLEGHHPIVGQNYRIGKIRQARLVSGNAPFAEPDFALYDLLLKEGENACGRYKALIHELISFRKALSHLTKA